MVTWYDEYGNVIETTYDNILNLKPNQKWKFTIDTYGDCSKFKITKVTFNNWSYHRRNKRDTNRYLFS